MAVFGAPEGGAPKTVSEDSKLTDSKAAGSLGTVPKSELQFDPVGTGCKGAIVPNPILKNMSFMDKSLYFLMAYQ